MQLSRILITILNFYELLIVVYVLSSWLPRSNWANDVRRALASIVEPYLGIFRRIIPSAGGLDFSPIIAIIVLNIVGQFVARLLVSY